MLVMLYKGVSSHSDSADEAMKACAYLPETLTDPKTAFSEEPSQSAVQLALGTDKALWDYYDTPEGKERGQRFAIVMSGANKLQPPETIVTGTCSCFMKSIAALKHAYCLQLAFEWSSVPQGGLIVDVGSGLGHVSLQVAKTRPDLHIALEDRARVITEAKDVRCFLHFFRCAQCLTTAYSIGQQICQNMLQRGRSTSFVRERYYSVVSH